MKKTFAFTPVSASFVWLITVIVRVYVKNDHSQNCYNIKSITESNVDVPDEISVDYFDEIEAFIDSTIDDWYVANGKREVEVVADPTAGFASHAEYMAWVYDNSEMGGLNETARKARQARTNNAPFQGFGTTDEVNAAKDVAMPAWMMYQY